MSDQDTQQEAPESFGSLLAKSRNSRGLSVADVAESLKITESYVRALEESTFEALPQAAFVRGYIRNYARLVGLDGEALVKDFDRCTGNDETPRLRGSRRIKPLRAHRSPSPVHALTLLLVVSLGGLSYYLWNHWLHAETTIESAVLGEAPVAATEPEMDLPPVIAAKEADAPPVAETTPVKVAEIPAADEGEQIPEPTANPTTEPQENAEPAIAMSEPPSISTKALVIDFSEDCWVEIKDVTGEVLVSTVQRAGSAIALEVFPPVSLRFGNTAGVKSITLDGKPEPKPSSTTRVASMLLDGSSQG